MAYIVFAGDHYYPRGLLDLQPGKHTEHQAKELAESLVFGQVHDRTVGTVSEKSKFDWAEVLDLNTLELVYAVGQRDSWNEVEPKIRKVYIGPRFKPGDYSDAPMTPQDEPDYWVPK